MMIHWWCTSGQKVKFWTYFNLMVALNENEEFAEVINLYSEGNTNIWSKFHDNHSNAWQHDGAKVRFEWLLRTLRIYPLGTMNVTMYRVSWQSVQQIVSRCFSLEKTGQTDGLSMWPAWLKLSSSYLSRCSSQLSVRNIIMCFKFNVRQWRAVVSQ